MWPEALPALGIIAGAITFAGTGLHLLNKWERGGKNKRWSLDGWDKKMMSRDERITGSKYKQQSL